MKRCPSCNRTYTDTSLNFCLEDGTPLVSDVVPAYDPNATVRDQPRQTHEPPPTEIYREKPLLNQVPEMAQPRPGPSSGQPAWGTGQAPPQWSPSPQPRPEKKSSAMWWVIGGIAVVGVLGIGLIVMILAVAQYSANSNAGNNDTRVANANRTTNTNTNTNRTANVNSNTSTLLPSLTEDFSEEKWRTGNFQFGDIWYKDGEYHMRSKEKTYLVMYAPSGDYSTENAAVSVTVRSVDGIGPTSGYGLVVHGLKSSTNELQDYALLIYTGEEPQYQVVLHKGGTQRTMVSWTKSSVIRPGTSPNQLEIRTRGEVLQFYINGRYLTRISDNEHLKGGVAGLYTSETSEVVFDDLEIKR